MNVTITDKWNTYLEHFDNRQKDIYYHEEYVKLYENAHSKALCIVCTKDDKILLMPFLRGEIESYYDYETQYGYGGPIANTSDADFTDKALIQMAEGFKANNYLCGFIRFHPLLDNASLCRNVMNVIEDRYTVAIITDKSKDDIWASQISSKNRNMIRKAQKSGLEYKSEHDFESIDEFIELYNATMKRIGAQDFYFFDKEYYASFEKYLNENAFLGTVRLDGKLICAAIFMYEGCYGHYHLEGSDYEYKSLGAGNLLIWESACHMHDLGVEKLHLGGGNSSLADDPLFKYKKAFSTNLAKFCIGKEIYNTKAYDDICLRWEKENPDKVDAFGGRLLKYRY